MRRSVAKRRLSDLQVAVLVILIAGTATFLAFRGELPFRHHPTVDWVVPNAVGIRNGSPVRIAGVQVGEVESVSSVQDGAQAAKLRLRIQDKGWPIHEDAHIRIRPRIFLEGNVFVDLSPGSPSAPTVDEGHTFPINSATAPVQLDQVLTALQGDTRQQLRNVLGELDDSFKGSGARGFNRSVPYWKAAYRDSALANTAALGVEPHDLSSYLKGAGTTAGALDRDPQRLQRLLVELDQTFGALADRQDQLRGTLTSLPRTLNAALPALRSVDRALPPVRRLAKDIVPAAKVSAPAIDDTRPFLAQLRGLVSPREGRGLVADLAGTVPSLARLNGELPGLLEQGRLNASCLNEVILPWSKDTIVDKAFPASGPVFQDSVKTLPGLAGESRSGDANGQWFRVLVSGGNYVYNNGNGNLLLTGQPLVGANPPKPAARSVLRSDVPCETQEPPDLRTIPTDMSKMGRRARVPASKQDEYEAIQGKAVSWLRRQLKLEDLTDKLRVSSEAATSDFIKSGKRGG